MPDSIPLPGYRWFGFLKNVPVRMGIYTGSCLALLFSAWVVAAERMPELGQWTPGRNLAALSVLGFVALLPVLRFYRSPYNQLLSGLIAWTILWLAFRVLGIFFSLLNQDYIPFQIFVLGSLGYMLSATVSWIGTIFWRARIDFRSHLR
ncbi:MAG TPA: hypothetical protein VGH37_20895 [Candidatus Acidoferrum sp.]